MATKAEILIQALRVELTTAQAQIEALRGEAVFTRQLSKDVAAAQTQLAQLTKTGELWGQRGWAVLTVTLSSLSALATGVTCAALTFYLNTKR